MLTETFRVSLALSCGAVVVGAFGPIEGKLVGRSVVLGGITGSLEDLVAGLATSECPILSSRAWQPLNQAW